MYKVTCAPLAAYMFVSTHMHIHNYISVDFKLFRLLGSRQRSRVGRANTSASISYEREIAFTISSSPEEISSEEEHDPINLEDIRCTTSWSDGIQEIRCPLVCAGYCVFCRRPVCSVHRALRFGHDEISLCTSCVTTELPPEARVLFLLRIKMIILQM